MNRSEFVDDLVSRAGAAADLVAELSTDLKNAALRLAAERLERESERLLHENALDLQGARENELAEPLVERLTLNPERILGMAEGLRQVAALADPVGEVTGMWNRPNGLQVGRMRIPLGVILVIYESRPNVTADVAALCLKSGNATLLRGGSEAIHSNRAIAAVLAEAIAECGVPADAVQLISRTDREIIDLLLEREGEVDLVVPRGGEGLIRRVSEKSRIPVI